ATLYLARVLRAAQGPAPASGLGPRMIGWGLLCGLGAAHHTTSLIWSAIDSVTIAIALVRAGAFRVWVPIAWLAGLVVPAIAYGGLSLRVLHPGTASVWPTLGPTWPSLLEHVTGRMYRGYLGHWSPDSVQAATLSREVYPFLWPAIAMLVAWAI